MTRVIKYNNYYNIKHWDYWACLEKKYCKPGEIHDGYLLVLSEESGTSSNFWRLVDLQIVDAYEHDGIIYEVTTTKNGKHKISKWSA